jgi:hypothetical protein
MMRLQLCRHPEAIDLIGSTCLELDARIMAASYPMLASWQCQLIFCVAGDGVTSNGDRSSKTLLTALR